MTTKIFYGDEFSGIGDILAFAGMTIFMGFISGAILVGIWYVLTHELFDLDHIQRRIAEIDGQQEPEPPQNKPPRRLMALITPKGKTKEQLVKETMNAIEKYKSVEEKTSDSQKPV